MCYVIYVLVFTLRSNECLNQRVGVLEFCQYPVCTEKKNQKKNPLCVLQSCLLTFACQRVNCMSHLVSYLIQTVIVYDVHTLFAVSICDYNVNTFTHSCHLYKTIIS